MTETKSIVVRINNEINTQLENKEVARALMATTFKGLRDEVQMKQALMEGMLRGYDFTDFLKKNIYAVPFKDNYSLVTSIDDARKRGMKSGVVGKSKPIYTEDEKGKIKTCEITIKRKVGDYVGDYTAEVYFDEYYKPGKNGYPSLWDTKPRTMIAKVAEMHALRMACPEELSQSYVEEEFDKEKEIIVAKEARYEEAKESVGELKMGNLVKNNEKEEDITIEPDQGAESK